MRLVFLFLFMFNISFCIYFTHKVYSANWLWKASIVILTFLGINTLSSLLGFYMCGNKVDRFGFAAANVLLLLLGMLILKRNGSRRIIIGGKSIFWAVSVFLPLFFLLFFSTGKELLPIWGNVDDIVHFEIVSSFYNSLNVENPLAYLGINSFEQRIEEFSYIWGYHYNCAAVSYALHIDVWHVMHFFRCFYTAMTVACPLLIMKDKNILPRIACIVLLLFNWNSWYAFLNSGYSPNIFALFFCFLSMGILSNLKEGSDSELGIKVLLPLSGLTALIAYLPVGIFFILFIAGYYCYRGKRKDCFRLLVAGAVVLPQPAIWKQITGMLQVGETTVAALQDSNWMKTPPSVMWAVIALITVSLAIYKKRFWDLWLCLILTVISVCLAVSPTSYMLHKMLMQARLLLIPYLCDIAAAAVDRLSKRRAKVAAFSALWIICVLLLNQVGVLKLERTMFPVTDARRQITAGELSCMEYVLKTLEDEDEVEYLGWDGPTAFIGEKILGKRPYVSKENSNSWRFRSNCSTQMLIDFIYERDMKIREGQKIILLVNTRKVEDLELLTEYSCLFQSAEKVYNKNESEVWELVVNKDALLQHS